MKKGEKIAEGKTKIIWAVPGTPDEVLIESKDDITAGDGVRHDTIKNKGVLATETTCNCFRLLNTMGVATHFIERVDERTFRAYRIRMIPMELVARRIATGSYLKRNPKVVEGKRLEYLPVEFFLKDDKRHDPLMLWSERKAFFKLYDAKIPLSTPIGTLWAKELLPGRKIEWWREVEWWRRTVLQLTELPLKVFIIFENAWVKQNVTLVDLKIECGYAADSRVLVADVIDNDS